MNEENKLNIITGNLLPTGKQHISYSELMDWVDCSWRHKLKHIDQIPIEEESEHLIFGSIVHDAIENWLNGIDKLNATATSEKVREELQKLKKFEDKKYEIDDWCIAVYNIFEELPSFMNDQYQNYKIIEAEHQLQESLEKKKDRYFKGFIDIILEYDELNKRNNKTEKVILIGDWKTSESGWTTSKKNDEYKQMQMILYKYFWCRKTNTDPSKVKCAWIILKRSPKKGTKHIECVFVPSEKEDMEKAVNKVYQMITTIEKKIYNKNRNSCTFCPYKHTIHCP